MGPTPQGGLRAEKVTIIQLIALAYGVRPFLVVDAPGWAALPPPTSATSSPQAATPTRRNAVRDRLRQRLKFLLAERCGLIVKHENSPMPVFKLVVPKGRRS
jgi:uncharacterized protein (TIGR03435 family)